MKTKKSPPTVTAEEQLRLEERKMILGHALSQLELAAIMHDHQPFYYEIGHNLVYFNAAACRKLFDSTAQRISLVRNRLDIERKSANVPRHLREVFEDPTQVMGLPTYVRIRLCRLECYTLLRVMLLGRTYFAARKEFGGKSMAAMDGLFAMHKCSQLFK